MTSPAAFAVVTAVRHWIYAEAGYLLRISQEGLTPNLAAEIASDFLVRRTIYGPRDAGAGRAMAYFADLLASMPVQSGMPMVERAAATGYALSQRDPSCLRGSPFSAATKVSWFLWPDNWTMYDRFTATAVLGRPESSAKQMERYYAALDCRGWSGLLREVRSALGGKLDARMAERIIDKYLLLSGADSASRDRWCRAAEAFATALPSEELREAIWDAARRIETSLNAARLLHRASS